MGVLRVHRVHWPCGRRMKGVTRQYRIRIRACGLSVRRRTDGQTQILGLAATQQEQRPAYAARVQIASAPGRTAAARKSGSECLLCGRRTALCHVAAGEAPPLLGDVERHRATRHSTQTAVSEGDGILATS